MQLSEATPQIVVLWSAASWSPFGLSRDYVQKDKLQEGRHIVNETMGHKA